MTIERLMPVPVPAGRLRSQFRDQPQYLLEHLSWDGDLGHLECNIAVVADDLSANF
jgi:hypothetical protein